MSRPMVASPGIPAAVLFIPSGLTYVAYDIFIAIIQPRAARDPRYCRVGDTLYDFTIYTEKYTAANVVFPRDSANQESSV